MGHIFLIRHGQDEDNAAGILNGRRDRPLTDLGREQASTVAEKLADEEITVIYTSPLQRAAATAAIIAKRLGVSEVVTHPDLIEREFGEMTGKPVASIKDLPPENVLVTDRVNYFLEIPGAENFPVLMERARRVLADIRDRHPKENVALVAHGDIGKMIRADFHDWSWREGLEKPYLDNTGVLELRQAGDVLE